MDLLDAGADNAVISKVAGHAIVNQYDGMACKE
jgi:hypothetical protein